MFIIYIELYRTLGCNHSLSKFIIKYKIKIFIASTTITIWLLPTYIITKIYAREL